MVNIEETIKAPHYHVDSFPCRIMSSWLLGLFQSLQCKQCNETQSDITVYVYTTLSQNDDRATFRNSYDALCIRWWPTSIACNLHSVYRNHNTNALRKASAIKSHFMTSKKHCNQLPEIKFEHLQQFLTSMLYKVLCARSRHQGQGQVITSYLHCGM